MQIRVDYEKRRVEKTVEETVNDTHCALQAIF